jgi:hypothetical protein
VTPSVLLLATALAAEEEPVPDDTLSEHRLPFSVLVERSIGLTSKPVEYNWRKSTVQVAATGSHLFELNNFNSLRAGGLVRFPTEGLMYEVGVSYVWVWDTPSSELLAFTPYRQPGRPPRLELDLTVGVPVAEGVVTSWPRRFPSVEMVFSVYASFRYLYYWGGFDSDMRARDKGAALVNPAMTDAEIENLDDRRLDAMQIDAGRYGVMAGVGNDFYFKQGVFVSPRAMFAVPVFAPMNGSDLWLWADYSLVIGVAF